METLTLINGRRIDSKTGWWLSFVSVATPFRVHPECVCVCVFFVLSRAYATGRCCFSSTAAQPIKSAARTGVEGLQGERGGKGGLTAPP